MSLTVEAERFGDPDRGSYVRSWGDRYTVWESLKEFAGEEPRIQYDSGGIRDLPSPPGGAYLDYAIGTSHAVGYAGRAGYRAPLSGGPWQKVLDTSGYGGSVAFANGRFLVLAQYDHYVSTDAGATWERHDVENFFGSLQAVGDLFFAEVETDQRDEFNRRIYDLQFSTDGISWWSPGLPRHTVACYWRGGYVAIGDGKVFRSSDARAWNHVATPQWAQPNGGTPRLIVTPGDGLLFTQTMEMTIT